jgi:hypothetical protein
MAEEGKSERAEVRSRWERFDERLVDGGSRVAVFVWLSRARGTEL